MDITAQSYTVRGCTQDALCLKRRSFGLGDIWCFLDGMALLLFMCKLVSVLKGMQIIVGSSGA